MTTLVGSKMLRLDPVSTTATNCAPVLIGAGMGVGTLGAKLATSPQARAWVVWLLLVVISAEAVYLVVHHTFQTH